MNQQPYNIEVTVANTTKEAFEAAMRLVCLDVGSYEKGEKKFKCIGYKIEDNELFLASYSDDCVKFPYEYNLQQTIDFAWGWWENNQIPTERAPDTDGSTKVAWLLTTSKCETGGRNFGMFVSIKPIWFIYGK